MLPGGAAPQSIVAAHPSSFKLARAATERDTMPLARPLHLAIAVAALLAALALAGVGASEPRQGGSEGLSAVVLGPVEGVRDLLGAADREQDRTEREGWRELRAQEEAQRAEAAAGPEAAAGEEAEGEEAEEAELLPEGEQAR